MVEMVKLLINKYNTKSTFNMLINYCIPMKYNEETVEIYLNLARILLDSNPNLIMETNENAETVLYKACEYGIPNLVEYFLKLNKKLINISSIAGNTPLYIACYNCPPRTLRNVYPLIIKTLIKYGANINLCNNNGSTAIYAICNCGNPNFVEILLSTNKCKLDIINLKGDSIIIHACRYGHSKVLETLLNYIDNKEFVYNYKNEKR
eukprot:163756_1